MKLRFKVGDYITYTDGYSSIIEGCIAFVDNTDPRKPYFITSKLEELKDSWSSIDELNVDEFDHIFGLQIALLSIKEKHKGEYCIWAEPRDLIPGNRLYTLDYIINILYHEIK